MTSDRLRPAVGLVAVAGMDLVQQVAARLRLLQVAGARGYDLVQVLEVGDRHRDSEVYAAAVTVARRTEAAAFLLFGDVDPARLQSPDLTVQMITIPAQMNRSNQSTTVGRPPPGESAAPTPRCRRRPEHAPEHGPEHGGDAVSAHLPAAGASIGAGPGAVRTVTAEEIGFELVNRCTVQFLPPGANASIRGRLLELVQPRSDGELRDPGLKEPATLYVVPDGTKNAIAFPVPTHTPVTVTVDLA